MMSTHLFFWPQVIILFKNLWCKKASKILETQLKKKGDVVWSRVSFGVENKLLILKLRPAHVYSNQCPSTVPIKHIVTAQKIHPKLAATASLK